MINLKKTTTLLIVITIVANIFGFVKDIVLSYFYGASTTTDVYLISLTISTAVFSFLGSAISTSYVPMYSNIEKKFGKHESKWFTNNLLNILFIIITLITILGLTFAEQLVKVFASGFEGTTLESAVEFTKISLLGGYFTVGILLFNAYLRLHGSYLVPALNGLIGHSIVILFIFLSTFWNEQLLIVGAVTGVLIQYIVLFPFLHKHGYKYEFVLKFKDPNIKKTALIAMPILLSNSISQINVLIDRTLASQLATGGISSLTYANKINGFVQGIFVLSIAHIMYPLISKLAANNQIIEFKEKVNNAIGTINFLVIPATVGAMVLSEPLILTLFGRGAFDEQAVMMTSNALFFYSLGMVGFGLREILSRAFYSLQDTKTPMINASIAVILNIILNIILSKYMGIGGLALATSISGIISSILLFINLRKKVGSLNLFQLYVSFVKILISSTIMGIIVYWSYSFISQNINIHISLFISIVLGIIIYLILNFLLKVKESEIIFKKIFHGGYNS
ncbi:murein biosynthesis integral membrane protein MurJ [Niallia sp. XMNu-256]|uniref:murein biosynthesis integral membrane protein MurJ n=1 Tax=Niallia sp. XMNu-256 TaxID=3082444 RepID=UPI0030CFF082